MILIEERVILAELNGEWRSCREIAGAVGLPYKLVWRCLQVLYIRKRIRRNVPLRGGASKRVLWAAP